MIETRNEVVVKDWWHLPPAVSVHCAEVPTSRPFKATSTCSRAEAEQITMYKQPEACSPAPAPDSPFPPPWPPLRSGRHPHQELVLLGLHRGPCRISIEHMQKMAFSNCSQLTAVNGLGATTMYRSFCSSTFHVPLPNCRSKNPTRSRSLTREANNSVVTPGTLDGIDRF